MKRGFSLIELLVSTAIAGLILSGLFAALYVATRSQTRVDRTTDEVMRASLVQRVMARDISGIFVPRKVEQETQEEGEQKKGAEKEAAQKKEQQDKDQDQPIKKLFYATQAHGQLEVLTFITNNPQQLFWGPVQAQPVPRVARVVYRLEQDKDKKGAYRLTRQEGTKLDYDAYRSGAIDAPRTYELIDGIKQMKVTYWYEPIKKEQAKKKEEQPKEKQKRVFKSVEQWVAQKKEEEKERIPLAPQYVQVTLVLWDKALKNEATYEFTLPIFSDVSSFDTTKPKDFTDLFFPSGKSSQESKGEGTQDRKKGNGTQVFQLLLEKNAQSV